ncbi:hypothetical protein Trco_007744 [Trichoderma cornu-damae]|uniref:HAT C-terminal dimerisation domain-containing protein n=1 Tax=Trichoderma cornu-damae TaxID=654480 RepID=A0A9P8TTH9_9HYPO|nr:hypothetical protein Trco_007744 [Trichoderma cornu-damae]
MTIKLFDDGSELDRYYRLNLPQQVDDPIQWWLLQQSSFPTLSKLALDLLAVLAMAADYTIEKIQCLKNWLHRGAISIGGLEGS